MHMHMNSDVCPWSFVTLALVLLFSRYIAKLRWPGFNFNLPRVTVRVVLVYFATATRAGYRDCTVLCV